MYQWNYENPFLITFRTLLSVQVSGLNVYETIIFSNCFATPFLFKKNKLENLSFYSLRINSLGSYNWPWALLESSFLYWVEMLSYISTYSSIPCGYTEQILLRTIAFQVFEGGYIHTPHHLCSGQFSLSHGFDFFTALSSGYNSNYSPYPEFAAGPTRTLFVSVYFQ